MKKTGSFLRYMFIAVLTACFTITGLGYSPSVFSVASYDIGKTGGSIKSDGDDAHTAKDGDTKDGGDKNSGDKKNAEKPEKGGGSIKGDGGDTHTVKDSDPKDGGDKSNDRDKNSSDKNSSKEKPRN
jgi:hypothetical protein